MSTPLVVIEPARKRYRRFDGRKVTHSAIADDLLVAEDVEQFRLNPDVIVEE